MHSAKITIIADQEIFWSGKAYNIHEIESITLDETGRLTDIHMKPDEQIEKDNDELSLDIRRSEASEKVRYLILSIENLIHEHVMYRIKESEKSILEKIMHPKQGVS